VLFAVATEIVDRHYYSHTCCRERVSMTVCTCMCLSACVFQKHTPELLEMFCTRYYGRDAVAEHIEHSV